MVATPPGPIAGRNRRSPLLRGVLLDVALVLNLGAFRKQPLMALLTTPANDVAPAFRRHPGTEPVLALPRTFRWLIGAFHDFEIIKK